MDPKINQQLFIQIESVDEEEAEQQYKSRIANMDQNTFRIEVPINEKTGRLKKLFSGDQLSVNIGNSLQFVAVLEDLSGG